MYVFVLFSWELVKLTGSFGYSKDVTHAKYCICERRRRPASNDMVHIITNMTPWNLVLAVQLLVAEFRQ